MREEADGEHDDDEEGEGDDRPRPLEAPRRREPKVDDVGDHGDAIARPLEVLLVPAMPAFLQVWWEFVDRG